MSDHVGALVPPLLEPELLLLELDEDEDPELLPEELDPLPDPLDPEPLPELVLPEPLLPLPLPLPLEVLPEELAPDELELLLLLDDEPLLDPPPEPLEDEEPLSPLWVDELPSPGETVDALPP